MAVRIIGKVKYNMTMTGTYKSGKRQGEQWEFLSLEILDRDTGFTWSCQLTSEDKSYHPVEDNALKDHKVKARITGQSASERTLPSGKTVMQIRSQLTSLEDLGEQLDDED